MSGLFAEQAGEYATSNREQVAEQLLDVACRKAIDIIRNGRELDSPHAVEDACHVIAKAQGRADRVLGPMAGVAS